MQVVAGSTGQAIFNERWLIRSLVNAGDGITLDYRLSASQEFELRAFLTNEPESVFERSVENPLVNVVNPNQVRLQIEELEELLRKRGGPKAEDRDDLVQLARWYAELHQHEKALTFLSQALRLINRPDDYILNLEGIYAGELGDYEREERAYRAADQTCGNWGTPMFNLGLSFHTRKKFEEALRAVDMAIEKEPSQGVYRTLRARCLRSLGKNEEAGREAEQAFDSYEPIPQLDDWELGWYISCAQTVGRQDAQAEAEQERSKRASTSHDSPGSDLPIITGGLAKT
jgi:tetratricopeptide (TPR) repeat protein